MIIGDKQLRRSAIPFRGNWMDGTGAIGNTFEPDGLVTGDLRTVLGTGLAVGGYIRILRPYKADIIEARLTLQATTPATGFAEIRFAGAQVPAGSMTPTTPTEAEIARDHKLLTGFDSALDYGTQDIVFIDGLDLMPIIPKRGDANFHEDFWVLWVDLFLKDGPTDWHLYDFKVDCSAQMGLI